MAWLPHPALVTFGLSACWPVGSVANHGEFSLDLGNRRSQWGNGKRPLNLGNFGDFRGICGYVK